MARKKLGEMLLDAGLVSEAQLNAALSDQQIWGGRVGTHLVKMGILSEDELAAFLSRQMEIPRIDFRKSKIQVEALERLPKRMCEQWKVIPVAYKESKSKKQLLLAMADPTNLEAIGEVEFQTGCTVRPVVAPESDIDAAIEYCYSVQGLRSSEGLSLVLQSNRRTTARSAESPVILTGGEEKVLSAGEEPMDFGIVRALLELLFEKNVISPEEFHRKMDRIRREGH